MEKRNIYERLNSGEAIRLDDPDFAPAVIEMVTARKTLHKINNEFHELDELPPLYEELFGETFQEATAIIPPFYIDFGSQFKISQSLSSVNMVIDLLCFKLLIVRGFALTLTNWQRKKSFTRSLRIFRRLTSALQR